MIQGLPPTVELLIASLEQEIANVPASQLPALLGELEQLKAATWTRLVTPPVNGNAQVKRTIENGKLLTPEEAADILSVKVGWLYRNWQHLPFARKLSRKALRFSEAGLRKWQVTRRC